MRNDEIHLLSTLNALRLDLVDQMGISTLATADTVMAEGTSL